MDATWCYEASLQVVPSGLDAIVFLTAAYMESRGTVSLPFAYLSPGMAPACGADAAALVHVADACRVVLQAPDRAMPLLQHASQLQPKEARWQLAYASCVWQTSSSFEVGASVHDYHRSHALQQHRRLLHVTGFGEVQGSPRSQPRQRRMPERAGADLQQPRYVRQSRRNACMVRSREV